LTNPNDLISSPEPGLTKKEYFAAMALQGLLSNHGANYASDFECVQISVNLADALITELNK
jgi:hypothetical protein